MKPTPKRRSPKSSPPEALLLFGSTRPSDQPDSVVLIPFKPVVVNLARLDALSPPWLRVSESEETLSGQSLNVGYRRIFSKFISHIAFHATREAKLEKLGSLIVKPLASGELRDRVGIVACFRSDAPPEDFEKAEVDIKTAGDAWCAAFRDAFVGALSGQRKVSAWRVWSEADEGLTVAALRKAMSFQAREADANILENWAPQLAAERERVELAAVKPKRKAKVGATSSKLPTASTNRRI